MSDRHEPVPASDIIFFCLRDTPAVASFLYLLTDNTSVSKYSTGTAQIRQISKLI